MAWAVVLNCWNAHACMRMAELHACLGIYPGNAFRMPTSAMLQSLLLALCLSAHAENGCFCKHKSVIQQEAFV